jgi:signal transduction histidine kinase
MGTSPSDPLGAPHHSDWLTLFSQVGQSLVAAIDLEQLLADIMAFTAEAMDSAAAAVLLVDEQTHELVFAAGRGRGAEIRRQRIGRDEGIAGWVAAHGQPVVSNAAARDPRFDRQVDVRTGFLTHSIVAVPLQVKGKTIGVLEVLNKNSERGFDEADLQAVSAIAAQAAVVVENARLLKSVCEEQDRLIRAQENVRHEVARELHDGLMQLLASISMGLEGLEMFLRMRPDALPGELERLRDMARQAAREARMVLFGLRPLILETQGLIPALRSYVDHLNESRNFAVRLTLNTAQEEL